VRRAVVDASVSLSWVLPDEAAGVEATGLLLAFQAGQVELLAPSLWEYEVANALRMGVKRGRLTEEQGASAAHGLLSLGLTLSHLGETLSRAWELAQQYRLSIYDASYLALAESSSCPLVTADSRLLEAAEACGLPRGLGREG
jgi:predicted nucleic acid-binding protein